MDVHKAADHATESTVAKMVGRLGTPVLLAIIGWFYIGDSNRTQQRLGAIEASNTQLRSDLRDLNSKLDYGVVQQLNAYSQRVDEHERRIQILERTVKTP